MKVIFFRPTRRLLCTFGVIVSLVGMLALGDEMGLFDARYEKPASEVFGTKSGEPIDAGFVFKDGVYVDAPYVVSRRGVDIYVNETKVATPVRWPPIDYDDKKPTMPAGLTKNSTFKDLEVPGLPGESLDRKMVRWLRRHYGDDEARELIVEYYKSLPFVKDVKVKEDMKRVIVIYTMNSKKGILMDIGEAVYRPPTPEDNLKTLERVRTRMEERLKKGDCFFLFSSGGELAFGARKAAMDLATIVRILRSSKSKDEKTEELQKLSFLPRALPQRWESLVTHFSASAQLEERVQQLRLSPGDKGEREHTVEQEQAIFNKIMKEKATKEDKSR